MNKLRTLGLLLALCAMSCAPAAVPEPVPAPATPSNVPANSPPQESSKDPAPAPQPETPSPEPEPEPDPWLGFQADTARPAIPSGYSRELKVLYLEQRFRWTARALNEALKRDSGIAYNGYFLDAQDGWTQPTSIRSDEARKRVRPLKGPLSTPDKFVPTQEQFLATGYDVIFLGDVDSSSREWKPEFFDWLEDWVKRGGGLVMLAGQSHHPSAYQSSAAYIRLCPLVLHDAEDTPDPVHIAEVKHLARTKAGEGHAILRLSSSDSRNRALFGGVTDGKYQAGELHGHYWHAQTGKPKDGAVVLARVGRDGQPVGEAQPVIVTQDYGRGRVLWIGTDDLHYWRQWVGDQYFYGFFSNVIRWAANDPGKQD